MMATEIITKALCRPALCAAKGFGGIYHNGAQYAWRYDAPKEFNGVLVRNDIQLTTAQLEERLNTKQEG